MKEEEEEKLEAWEPPKSSWETQAADQSLMTHDQSLTVKLFSVSETEQQKN